MSAPKLAHVQVLPIGSIRPAHENGVVYAAISVDDPEVRELAKSIKARGIQEPLLISQDGYIISGHRRWVAAQIAGLKEVPCRVDSISRAKYPDEFKRLLVVGVY